MSLDTKTIPQWVHHLTAPDARLTITELMALALLTMRDNGLLAREATEHTEGMVGSLDEFAAELAYRMGLPYNRRGKPDLRAMAGVGRASDASMTSDAGGGEEGGV